MRPPAVLWRLNAPPVPALTGTCKACGENVGTTEGLIRHNQNASVGEQSYLGRIALARREGK